MADEQTQQQTKSKPPRSARLGDRVFYWSDSVDGLKHRPAWLSDYSPLSKQFLVNVMTEQGSLMSFGLVPWSAKPAPFHWTFEDQVKPIPVE